MDRAWLRILLCLAASGLGLGLRADEVMPATSEDLQHFSEALDRARGIEPRQAAPAARPKAAVGIGAIVADEAQRIQGGSAAAPDSPARRSSDRGRGRSDSVSDTRRRGPDARDMARGTDAREQKRRDRDDDD